MNASPPKAIRLEDYTPPAFLIERVSLVIKLDPNRTRVESKLHIVPNPKVKRTDASLVLDGVQLELESLKLDGKTLKPSAFNVDDTSLTIANPPTKPFTLEAVTYVNPEANTALQGIYRSRGIFCSQCEAEGFRRITYFLDRPDVLSVYTVRLEADVDTAPVLLANGNPRERGTLPGKRHYAVWHDPHPKPCYLFAVVGGDLGRISSTFTTMSGRNVELGIFVEHGKEDRAHWAMDSLKRSMAWDERTFGREYDLDVFNIVAVSDFNMGAMENKGLNIFNDRLVLASAETATDSNFEAIESVVAHEYFHNWTGNRITCRDWFQLCLKEGLTVFRDQEFSADERDRTVQRITDVRQLKALQFPEDQGPLAHPVRPSSYIEINNFYTPTVYEKGAELVRMIATILGPKDFRAGMDLYFERHDGDAATIEDFLACFEEASGQSMTHFALWYAQAGTPELVCNFHYDKKDKRAELTVEQSLQPTPGQPKKKPLMIPLRFGLIGANGQDIDLDLTRGQKFGDDVLAVTKSSQKFVFKNVPSRPVPSVLRGFSAPVNVTMNVKDSDLAFLMTHDSDLFNRWQAANGLAVRSMLKALTKISSKKQTTEGSPSLATIITEPANTYADAIKSALYDENLDDAYRAELLKLPSQSDIAREKGSNVDHARIDRVHRAFTKQVGRRLGSDLIELYQRCRDEASAQPFSADATSAGRRALANAALTLLYARGTAADKQRLVTHFESAKNMTDTVHTMGLIAGSNLPQRGDLIQAFHDRWQNDHLVIDLWFATQAMSPRSDTLGRIRELMKHPLFKLSTPNKVRALIGTFAMGNPLQFNRPDGSGYDFVADTALQVDRLNPQIAARLLGAFRSYKSVEPKRRAKARAALEKVARTPDVSRDTQEMVGRMLEG